MRSLLYPYVALFGFGRGSPLCPRGTPGSGDDSLRNVQRKTDNNSAACGDDSTDGICQLCHPVATPRLRSLCSSVIANRTAKATTQTLVHSVCVRSRLQVCDNSFPIQL